jgi:hypothetical protein
MEMEKQTETYISQMCIHVSDFLKGGTYSHMEKIVGSLAGSSCALYEIGKALNRIAAAQEQANMLTQERLEKRLRVNIKRKT